MAQPQGYDPAAGDGGADMEEDDPLMAAFRNASIMDHPAAKTVDRQLRVNAGGTVYTTLVNTLNQFGPGPLTNLVNAYLNLHPDRESLAKADPLFLDLDPRLFEALLRVLRMRRMMAATRSTGKEKDSSKFAAPAMPLDQLVQEYDEWKFLVAFYELEGLQAAVKTEDSSSSMSTSSNNAAPTPAGAAMTTSSEQSGSWGSKKLGKTNFRAFTLATGQTVLGDEEEAGVVVIKLPNGETVTTLASTLQVGDSLLKAMVDETLVEYRKHVERQQQQAGAAQMGGDGTGGEGGKLEVFLDVEPQCCRILVNFLRLRRMGRSHKPPLLPLLPEVPVHLHQDWNVMLEYLKVRVDIENIVTAPPGFVISGLSIGSSSVSGPSRGSGSLGSGMPSTGGGLGSAAAAPPPDSTESTAMSALSDVLMGMGMGDAPTGAASPQQLGTPQGGSRSSPGPGGLSSSRPGGAGGSSSSPDAQRLGRGAAAAAAPPVETLMFMVDDKHSIMGQQALMVEQAYGQVDVPVQPVFKAGSTVYLSLSMIHENCKQYCYLPEAHIWLRRKRAGEDKWERLPGVLTSRKELTFGRPHTIKLDLIRGQVTAKDLETQRFSWMDMSPLQLASDINDAWCTSDLARVRTWMAPPAFSGQLMTAGCTEYDDDQDGRPAAPLELRSDDVLQLVITLRSDRAGGKEANQPQNFGGVKLIFHPVKTQDMFAHWTNSDIVHIDAECSSCHSYPIVGPRFHRWYDREEAKGQHEEEDLCLVCQFSAPRRADAYELRLDRPRRPLPHEYESAEMVTGGGAFEPDLDMDEEEEEEEDDQDGEYEEGEEGDDDDEENGEGEEDEEEDDAAGMDH